MLFGSFSHQNKHHPLNFKFHPIVPHTVYCDHVWAFWVPKCLPFLYMKKANNSANNNIRDLKFTQEMLCLWAHIVSKFQPCISISSKVIANLVHFSFFHTNFPCKTQYSPILGEISHLIYSCQEQSFWQILKPYFSFFQHNGLWTACFPTTQIQLAFWRPATCIWGVERSNYISPSSIQLQQGNLVCYNCQLSR